MGAVFPISFTNIVQGIRGLFGSGVDQGSAVPLTRDVNVFETVAAGQGAILPSSYAPGARILVINRGANALLVYPAGIDVIEDAGPGVPVSVPAGINAEFASFDPPLSPPPRTWWVTLQPNSAVGALLAANDLSDLTNVSQAVNNLGLQNAAQTPTVYTYLTNVAAIASYAGNSPALRTAGYTFAGDGGGAFYTRTNTGTPAIVDGSGRSWYLQDVYGAEINIMHFGALLSQGSTYVDMQPGWAAADAYATSYNKTVFIPAAPTGYSWRLETPMVANAPFRTEQTCSILGQNLPMATFIGTVSGTQLTPNTWLTGTQQFYAGQMVYTSYNGGYYDRIISVNAGTGVATLSTTRLSGITLQKFSTDGTAAVTILTAGDVDYLNVGIGSGGLPSYNIQNLVAQGIILTQALQWGTMTGGVLTLTAPPAPVTFNGYISNASNGSATLYVTSAPSAYLYPSGTLTGAGVSANTTIIMQLTGTAGGSGTYLVYPAQTVGSSGSPIAFTQTYSTSGNLLSNTAQIQCYSVGGVLTVVSNLSGLVGPNATLSGGGFTSCTIGAPTSGATTGPGTYPISVSQTVGSVGSPVTATLTWGTYSQNPNQNSISGPGMAMATVGNGPQVLALTSGTANTVGATYSLTGPAAIGTATPIWQQTVSTPIPIWQTTLPNYSAFAPGLTGINLVGKANLKHLGGGSTQWKVGLCNLNGSGHNAISDVSPNGLIGQRLYDNGYNYHYTNGGSGGVFIGMLLGTTNLVGSNGGFQGSLRNFQSGLQAAYGILQLRDGAYSSTAGGIAGNIGGDTSFESVNEAVIQMLPDSAGSEFAEFSGTVQWGSVPLPPSLTPTPQSSMLTFGGLGQFAPAAQIDNFESGSWQASTIASSVVGAAAYQPVSITIGSPSPGAGQRIDLSGFDANQLLRSSYANIGGRYLNARTPIDLSLKGDFGVRRDVAWSGNLFADPEQNTGGNALSTGGGNWIGSSGVTVTNTPYASSPLASYPLNADIEECLGPNPMVTAIYFPSVNSNVRLPAASSVSFGTQVALWQRYWVMQGQSTGIPFNRYLGIGSARTSNGYVNNNQYGAAFGSWVNSKILGVDKNTATWGDTTGVLWGLYLNANAPGTLYLLGVQAGLGELGPYTRYPCPASNLPFKFSVYTVATLPTGMPAGSKAFVSDATAPTFQGSLTGGGTVFTPVYYNGTAWLAG